MPLEVSSAFRPTMAPRSLSHRRACWGQSFVFFVVATFALVAGNYPQMAQDTSREDDLSCMMQLPGQPSVVRASSATVEAAAPSSLSEAASNSTQAAGTSDGKTIVPMQEGTIFNASATAHVGGTSAGVATLTVQESAVTTNISNVKPLTEPEWSSWSWAGWVWEALSHIAAGLAGKRHKPKVHPHDIATVQQASKWAARVGIPDLNMFVAIGWGVFLISSLTCILFHTFSSRFDSSPARARDSLARQPQGRFTAQGPEDAQEATRPGAAAPQRPEQEATWRSENWYSWLPLGRRTVPLLKLPSPRPSAMVERPSVGPWATATPPGTDASSLTSASAAYRGEPGDEEQRRSWEHWASLLQSMDRTSSQPRGGDMAAGAAGRAVGPVAMHVAPPPLAGHQAPSLQAVPAGPLSAVTMSPSKVPPATTTQHVRWLPAPSAALLPVVSMR